MREGGGPIRPRRKACAKKIDCASSRIAMDRFPKLENGSLKIVTP
jgi:hypothetical protein